MATNRKDLVKLSSHWAHLWSNRVRLTASSALPLHAASAPLQSGRQVHACPALQVTLIVRANLHCARQAGTLVSVLKVTAVGSVEHGVARRPPADHVPSLVALSPKKELAVGVLVISVEEDLRVFDRRRNQTPSGKA